MRALRILILIIFIVTGGLFGVHEVRHFADLDDKAPVLKIDHDEIALSVEAGEDEYLKGVTAADEHDGDVTDSIVIAGKSNFIEEGLIRVDYAAFDKHNNVGTASRNIRFTDYSSPRFASDQPFLLRKSTNYNFDFIHASDVVDGDITNKVKVMYTSLYSATDESPLTLEATNSLGDIEKLDLTVRILTPQEYNQFRPALWEYIVYTGVGQEIEPWNYVAGVWQSGNPYSFEDTGFDYENISVDASAVDYWTPGVYEVVYYFDAPKRDQTATYLYIVVRDE